MYDFKHNMSKLFIILIGCRLCNTFLTTSLQLCPFPFDYIKEETEKYRNAEITWAQEEPKNMGYWSYVKPRIETATGHGKKVW
jgi:2-oxoglutarate dehydrogenase E1 component